MRTSLIARLVAMVGVVGLMAAGVSANAAQVSMTVDNIVTSTGLCTLTLTDKVTLSDPASTWDLEQLMLDGTAVQTWHIGVTGIGTHNDQESITVTATGSAKTYTINFHDEGVVSSGPTRWSLDTNSTTVTVNP